jgi:hypothetical protein
MSPGRRKNGLVKQRSNRFVTIAASFGIAVGLVIVGIGVLSAETGRDALDLPAAIQSTNPIRGSVRVPAQTPVVVDLEAGYEGVLVIDGLELPTIDLSETGNPQQEDGKEVQLPPGTVFEPGNATLTFTPSRGAPIETFAEGLHTVNVVFWKTVEGRDSASSYAFTFSVF